MNILLGLTGSVASTISPKIIEELDKLGIVHVVPTSAAARFASSDDLKGAEVFYDEEEWVFGINRKQYKKGDAILHIELRKWADIMVVAPLSAHTLAKLANGLSDNLLTSVARAWDWNKPMILAPAMNTHMWDHPVTEKHLSEVQKFGARIVYPQNKTLACGDVGNGAMAEISEIIKVINKALIWDAPFWFTSKLPMKGHPGSFGFQRRHDVHTGVDLYCSEGCYVKAMEYGIVEKIIPFTGSKVFGKDGKPMDWWLDTDAVIIKGASGYILYGEIIPADNLKEGDVVQKGAYIGKVTPVLRPGKERPDIPGHSRSMLHVELYSELYSDLSRCIWEGWEIGKEKPEKLLDPTQKIMDAMFKANMDIEFLRYEWARISVPQAEKS